MENDNMTQAEFVAYLETLADLIEVKATTPKEAAKMLRRLADKLKPQQTQSK